MLFSAESIARDLDPNADKSERPSWPLATYGPAKYQPNLLPGLDESPEELRVRAALAAQTNTTAEYVKYEADRIATAGRTIEVARMNVQDLLQQAQRNADGKVSPGSSGSAFGNATSASALGKQSGAFGSTTSPSASGGPSALGQPAFGQSAFGQPVKGASAFSTQSQPTSAFGQAAQPTSAFGSPAPGPVTSAFGQPSLGPTASAFGQPTQSSLIKPASGAFGGGTTSGGFSAFANQQPSAFSLAAAANVPNTSGGSVFGQSSLGNTPSAFGNTTQTQPVTSAFGQPVSSASASNTPQSAFSSLQSTQMTSAFGAPQNAQAASAFGTPQNTQVASAFGTPQNTPATSAFGSTTPSQPTSAFASTAPAQPSVAPGQGASSSAALPKAQASSGKPDFEAAKKRWKAKPGRDNYDDMLPADYAEVLPPEAIQAFRADRFELGKIPEFVPPKELRGL